MRCSRRGRGAAVPARGPTPARPAEPLPRRSPLTARRLTVLALTALLLAGTALPAAADPARPTNFRSVVTEVEPAVDGLTVEVLGGDAYVAVQAPAGTTLEVEGYEGEPYVRIGEDGTVERNEASPTRWLNDARYGALDVSVPPEASAAAPPRWEVVADGGEYAWHDHRVHWMSPELPPQIDTGRDEVQEVLAWELELALDGQPLVVRGELDWVPGPSAVVPGLLGLLAVALGLVLGWRAAGRGPLVAAVGAVVAGVGGVAASAGLPAGADQDPVLVILPAVTLLLAGVGAWAVRNRPGLAPRLVAALAGFPLGVWAVLQIGALTRPIVPTQLPTDLARVLVTVTLAVGIAALVGAARTLLTPAPAAGPTTAPAAPAGGDR
ncbi:hypothetical protein FTX61_07125 [Nitriliruptoraceae bacterium ZYF776]|nr:hypothetical protein [Profundirhabdus halotolerans]